MARRTSTLDQHVDHGQSSTVRGLLPVVTYEIISICIIGFIKCLAYSAQLLAENLITASAFLSTILMRKLMPILSATEFAFARYAKRSSDDRFYSTSKRDYSTTVIFANQTNALNY